MYLSSSPRPCQSVPSPKTSSEVLLFVERCRPYTDEFALTKYCLIQSATGVYWLDHARSTIAEPTQHSPTTRSLDPVVSHAPKSGILLTFLSHGVPYPSEQSAVDDTQIQWCREDITSMGLSSQGEPFYIIACFNPQLINYEGPRSLVRRCRLPSTLPRRRIITAPAQPQNTICCCAAFQLFVSARKLSQHSEIFEFFKPFG